MTCSSDNCTARSKQQLLWADHSYRNKDEEEHLSSAPLHQQALRSLSLHCFEWGRDERVTSSHSYVTVRNPSAPGSLKMPVPSRLLMLPTVSAYKSISGGEASRVLLKTTTLPQSVERWGTSKNQSKQTNPHLISLLSIILDGLLCHWPEGNAGRCNYWLLFPRL